MESETKPEATFAGKMVVLDRIADAPDPDYCLHGKTWCTVCGSTVHLGSVTKDAVLNGALPICLPCARLHIPPDQAPITNLQNHKRADGPHD